MIVAMARAATSFNVLTWVSVAAFVVAVATAVWTTISFRSLLRDRATRERPSTTFHELLRPGRWRHDESVQSASQSDEPDRVG
jgi:hypothetical protein